MEFSKSMAVAASGLRAQSARMKIIAENIANANSTAAAPGGDPYRRKIATMTSSFDRELDARVVTAGKAEFLQGVGDVVFDRVQADAETGRDLRIGQAVTHAFADPPFGGSQHIVEGRASGLAHRLRTIALSRADFPTRTAVAPALPRDPTAADPVRHHALPVGWAGGPPAGSAGRHRPYSTGSSLRPATVAAN